MSTPTIVELVDVCERMAATSRGLFEIVGGWVADEPDPAAQRWFSAGAHRHAWHAELWEARRPAVPIDSRATSGSPVVSNDDRERVPWYRDQLRRLVDELDAFAGRVDVELDPSTVRTVTLVRADLVELIAVHDR